MKQPKPHITQLNSFYDTYMGTYIDVITGKFLRPKTLQEFSSQIKAVRENDIFLNAELQGLLANQQDIKGDVENDKILFFVKDSLSALFQRFENQKFTIKAYFTRTFVENSITDILNYQFREESSLNEGESRLAKSLFDNAIQEAQANVKGYSGKGMMQVSSKPMQR